MIGSQLCLRGTMKPKEKGPPSRTDQGAGGSMDERVRWAPHRGASVRARARVAPAPADASHGSDAAPEDLAHVDKQHFPFLQVLPPTARPYAVPDLQQSLESAGIDGPKSQLQDSLERFMVS